MGYNITMYKNYFHELWQLQQRWAYKIFYEKIIDEETFGGFTSSIPGEYFNLVFPKVNKPEDLNLSEILHLFAEIKEKPAIFLFEDQAKDGFVEYLVRQGYKFECRDCWMGYDPKTYNDKTISSKIIEVTPKTFSDFKTVLGEIFKKFPGNTAYLEICEKTLKGDLVNDFTDLKSRFFLIYENGKPVSGAGMFSSVKNNFAYLHDAGTLKDFRGKGYQSDLIHYRVNKAVEEGINRIYSSVDHRTQSWSNFINCGLNQMHMGILLVNG